MAVFHSYYKQLLGAEYHTPNLVWGSEAWLDLGFGCHARLPKSARERM